MPIISYRFAPGTTEIYEIINLGVDNNTVVRTILPDDGNAEPVVTVDVLQSDAAVAALGLLISYGQYLQANLYANDMSVLARIPTVSGGAGMKFTLERF